VYRPLNKFFRTRNKSLPRVGLTVVCMVAVFSALSACHGKGDPAAVATPERRASVEVVTAASSLFTETYEVTAVAEPVQSFHLSAEVGGTVVELAADLGDRVARDEVLVRFDPVPFELLRDTRQAEYDRAQIRRDQAEKNLVRYRALHQEGGVSDIELDDAELAARLAGSDLKLAAIALKNAERDLSHTVVKAPTDGEITRRFPERGVVMSPGQPLFHLVRADRLRFSAGLSESQVGHVRVGSVAEVRVDALADKKALSGRVVSIASADSLGEATFPVEVQVANPGGRVRPGMVARIGLAGRSLPNAVVVPAVALRRGTDGVGLFVVEGEVARRVTVDLAALVDESAYLISGLLPGARVVVVGQTALRGGEAVDVVAVDGHPTRQRDSPAVDGLP